MPGGTVDLDEHFVKPPKTSLVDLLIGICNTIDLLWIITKQF